MWKATKPFLENSPTLFQIFLDVSKNHRRNIAWTPLEDLRGNLWRKKTTDVLQNISILSRLPVRPALAKTVMLQANTCQSWEGLKSFKKNKYSKTGKWTMLSRSVHIVDGELITRLTIQMNIYWMPEV